MKNCWNCDGKIPSNAKICKFCQSVQLNAHKEQEKQMKKENAKDGKKQT